MTKKEIAQAEAVKTLQEWGVVDGTTVYAKVVRVSASGMSRQVRLYFVPKDGNITDITYWSAKALEWGYGGEGYRNGIRVSGCGMDMLFHTIYSLSYAMGYGALNQHYHDQHLREPKTHDQDCPECRRDNHEKIEHIGLKYKQL